MEQISKNDDNSVAITTTVIVPVSEWQEKIAGIEHAIQYTQYDIGRLTLAYNRDKAPYEEKIAALTAEKEIIEANLAKAVGLGVKIAKLEEALVEEVIEGGPL